MTASSENLLDAQRSPVAHRISIKTDQKRWWPKTIYHTYWSRFSFWIQRNILWTLLGVAMASLIAYLLLLAPSYSASTYNASAESILRNIKDKFNDPSFFNYSPHQEKLKPYAADYIAPDTYLNWQAVTNSSNKVKAAFVSVVQENDVYRLRNTMIGIERHFNEREGYPWVIISDKVLSKKFREWIVSSSKAPVYFGQAPAIEWQEPYWIDIKKAEHNMKDMVKEHNIDHGESMSWRRMTRYNMGFVAHHPLLKDLEYYWKVQPGSDYSCDITEDPFKRMKKNSFKLAFSVTMTENHENMDEFFDVVENFIVNNKEIIQPVDKSIYKSLLNEATRNQKVDKKDPLGEYKGHFSNCMIYNSYGIYSLEYLRSKEYTKFFDELDTAGGFFYHKWGDALPQSLAAALFLKKSEITFGELPGYQYGPASVCPSELSQYADLKCTCVQRDWRVNNMRYCSPAIMKSVLGM